MKEWTSGAGVMRAVKKKFGVTTLDAAIDALGYERIAPATAWPGDIIGFPADDDEGSISLGIAISGGKVIAFYGADANSVRCQTADYALCTHAWRVL